MSLLQSVFPKDALAIEAMLNTIRMDTPTVGKVFAYVYFDTQDQVFYAIVSDTKRELFRTDLFLSQDDLLHELNEAVPDNPIHVYPYNDASNRTYH